MSAPENLREWKRLCGLAVALVGSQAAFRVEARILARLVKQYGTAEVERMIAGAKLLGWRSLKSLGSAEGLGRRMAVQAWWRSQNAKPAKLPERLKAILLRMGQ